MRFIDGPNQLRALALSKDRIESNPMEITVTLRGAERESDLHLVLVGVNRYKNSALNLTYAEPDATGMRDFFRSEGVKRLFKEVHVYMLLNDQATGANIRRLFGEVEKKARPQDTLLIYLAGHGDTVGEEWYFVPHDVVTPEIEADLKRDGISNTAISEAIKRSKAQKVFVMIDACKSGKLILAMRSTEARKALVQLARSTGTYIISASTDQQYAAEIKELGHGVFTYTLLEGLQGKGGREEGDGGGAHPLRQEPPAGAHGETPGPGPVPRELGLGHGLPHRALLISGGNMMCNLFSRIRVGLIVCLLTAGFAFSIDSVAIAQFDSPPPPSNLTPLFKLGQKDSIPNEAKEKHQKWIDEGTGNNIGRATTGKIRNGVGR